MTSTGLRFLAAGGSLANLGLAGLCLLVLHLSKSKTGPTHYFVWLLAALNLLVPFAYVGFSGIGGFGDWAIFVEGLQPMLLYRVLLIGVGGFLYFSLTPRLLMPVLDLYLGHAQRDVRAKAVALLPYLAGSTTCALAGLLNPQGLLPVFLSAVAASFGGTSWLAWYPGGKRDSALGADSATHAAAPGSIARSIPWMVAGGIVFVLFVFVLGPGIDL
jgi:hypothetical protein